MARSGATTAQIQPATEDGGDQVLMPHHLFEGSHDETRGALQRAEIIDHDLLAVDDLHRRHEPRLSFSNPVVSPVGYDPTTL
jgi:hypothetical protein